MKNVGLYGPGPDCNHLDPVLNSDGYILVPRNFPICVWNFARRLAAGLTGTNRGASGPQIPMPEPCDSLAIAYRCVTPMERG